MKEIERNLLEIALEIAMEQGLNKFFIRGYDSANAKPASIATNAIKPRA